MSEIDAFLGLYFSFNPFAILRRPCILIFDSLGGEQESSVNILREYLTCEYAAKMQNHRVFDTSNTPGHSVRVPIQPNLNDCGLFVLQNIEQFFKVSFSNCSFSVVCQSIQ